MMKRWPLYSIFFASVGISAWAGDLRHQPLSAADSTKVISLLKTTRLQRIDDQFQFLITATNVSCSTSAKKCSVQDGSQQKTYFLNGTNAVRLMKILATALKSNADTLDVPVLGCSIDKAAGNVASCNLDLN